MSYRKLFALCLLVQYQTATAQTGTDWGKIIADESMRLTTPTTTTTTFVAGFGSFLGPGATCELRNGLQGICVASYLCTDGRIIDDGSGLFDDRIGAKCDFGARIPLVCCMSNSETTTSYSGTLVATEPAITASAATRPAATSPVFSDSARNLTETVSSYDTCGWSNKGGLELLPDRLGGADDGARYGEFPFLVALGRSGSSTIDIFGSGTIIHPSVVLTAAHKVYTLKKTDFIVRAGEFSTEDNEEVQDQAVDRIIIHEHFEKRMSYNNMALLVLNSPFKMGKVIIPGCLGRAVPDPGTKCISMGWGKGLVSSKQTKVKKVTLPLVSKTECETSLRTTRLGNLFELHPSLICAGGIKNEDTCKGDGGSPLVCKIEKERYAVYGIVAYGIGCGNTNPALYTNVPYLFNWIGEQMNKLGYGTDYYSYKGQ